METINLKYMDTNFINAVRNNFENLVIDANAASVQRAEFGFVNKDCDLIKSMIGTICIHALENIFIFDKTQSINIRELINIINNG
jgi:hypothetical protein